MAKNEAREESRGVEEARKNLGSHTLTPSAADPPDLLAVCGRYFLKLVAVVAPKPKFPSHLAP